MKNSPNIKKLPQTIINQIAAGEVIERPASVVKELVDNSLDAGADRIEIHIDKGGLRKIEVRDNGIGMDRENLIKAFEAHTTSKITALEDLNELLTLGFRGEALSTIVSVAEVTAISKSTGNTEAFKVVFDGIEPKEITVTAGNQGTTISVENIFNNIPARHKFLRSESTEYRKVTEILIPYFLLHSDVHFLLYKDGKERFNLPPETGCTEEGGGETPLSLERIRKVLKGDFAENMLPFNYEGDGVRIEGYIARPSYAVGKTVHQYVFVNNRAIKDRGIQRSVYEGISRYIPAGKQLPFVMKISLPSNVVDINVHPRKEEVRFANPFRVYAAIERTVQHAMTQVNLSADAERHIDATPTRVPAPDPRAGLVAPPRRQPEGASLSLSDTGPKKYKVTPGSLFNITYTAKGNDTDTDDRADKIQTYVNGIGGNSTQPDDVKIDPLPVDVDTDLDVAISNTAQFFLKYIIYEIGDTLWILDQHAAAERITFEKLSNASSEAPPEVQNMLMPAKLQLSEPEMQYVADNAAFFRSIGFDLELNDEDGSISVKSLPAILDSSKVEQIFRDIMSTALSESAVSAKSGDLERQKGEIIAEIACHNSIRSGQSLSRREHISLLRQLLECENSYSCPHGRPLYWKLDISEIDKNFDRTY